MKIADTPNHEPFTKVQIADIPDYETFTKVQPLDEGLSSDKKYYVETTGNQRLCLRISDISTYENKKAKYEMMERVAALGVPMSRPVDFGICDNGNSVYQLLTWCDGEILDNILPLLTETEQYVIGIKSGEILRMIHSLAIPEPDEDWQDRFTHVIEGRIQAFHNCGVRFDGWETILNYYEDNRHLLKGRPQSYLHGDFHGGNLLLANHQDLSVIDWELLDFEGYGDPWVDFGTDMCTISPHYATGQVRGYFSGEPPEDFWRIFAFYVTIGSLNGIPWAYYMFPDKLASIIENNTRMLEWFENMKNPVPTWYLRDFYIQCIDGVPFRLKAPFDFSFLKKYGQVFRVFDDQDSGNICFGVADGQQKYFVKFAGAPTFRAGVSAEDAISILKRIAAIYRDLAHPNLIRLASEEEIGGGYAVVFEWTDAICMGKQYPEEHRQFMTLPLMTQVKIFEDIMAFHAHVAVRGYVAIDFYDGSIMYDRAADKVIICDIDYYEKVPYTNQIGRMWGSSSFMSPEEFTLGAAIDEIANVYTMGATAFALLTNKDRTPEAWPLDMNLYDVVKRATSDKRGKRQQSIRQLIEEWEAAKH